MREAVAGIMPKILFLHAVDPLIAVDQESCDLDALPCHPNHAARDPGCEAISSGARPLPDHRVLIIVVFHRASYWFSVDRWHPQAQSGAPTHGEHASQVMSTPFASLDVEHLFGFLPEFHKLQPEEEFSLRRGPETETIFRCHPVTGAAFKPDFLRLHLQAFIVIMGGRRTISKPQPGQTCRYCFPAGMTMCEGG